MQRGSHQRRRFLKHACAGGLASILANALPCPAPASDDSTESKTKSYPSHGPGRRWLRDSRKLIANILLPPPKCRRINEQLAFSFRLENVFYLNLGEKAVLIDTGFDHQADLHLENLKSLGCKLENIIAILGTHSHVDHTGGLKRVQDRLQVPIIAHRHATEPIGKGDLLRTAAVIPELDGWRFEFPACKIDETVDNGDMIVVGDEKIRLVHIPGHTPDCLGYLWKDYFFTGDAVFGSGSIGWANERWLSNYTEHLESMKQLLAAQLPAKTFYAAHGRGLPYDSNVPHACIKTLDRLIARKEDPCNHTPRTQRRGPKELPREVSLG